MTHMCAYVCTCRWLDSIVECIVLILVPSLGLAGAGNDARTRRNAHALVLPMFICSSASVHKICAKSSHVWQAGTQYVHTHSTSRSRTMPLLLIHTHTHTLTHRIAQLIELRGENVLCVGHAEKQTFKAQRCRCVSMKPP